VGVVAGVVDDKLAVVVEVVVEVAVVVG